MAHMEGLNKSSVLLHFADLIRQELRRLTHPLAAQLARIYSRVLLWVHDLA